MIFYDKNIDECKFQYFATQKINTSLEIKQQKKEVVTNIFLCICTS